MYMISYEICKEKKDEESNERSGHEQASTQRRGLKIKKTRVIGTHAQSNPLIKHLS